jgi:predicted unusual protein kinase regulating ubiquinone biosynthesis (AarF/ABC1/UbiB family)
MMLVDNLIHSDLHPGNILVRLEQPHGLVGLAYKALNALANPDGLPMRALSAALEALSRARRTGGAGAGGSGAGAAAPAAAAVTVDAAGKAQQVAAQPAAVAASCCSSSSSSSSSRSSSSSSYASRARAWLSQARATWSAGGANALLALLQSQLHEVTAAWLQPHIVLLDVGMATELSPEDQHNMVGLFR